MGSLLPPFLLGVVFSGLIKGLPIDGDMEMKADLFDMVNLYTLVGGVTVVMLCLVHGLMFTSLRTTGDLRLRARKLAKKLLIPLAILFVLFAVLTLFETDVFKVRGVILSIIAVIGVVVFLLSGWFMTKQRDGWAFSMTGTLIVLSIASVFIGLFPRLMVSSISDAFSLTVDNAASGQYSLKVMTIVSLTLLPFVLGYQIWSYFVFHKRVSEKEHLEY
ncbi:Cytochrome bd-I ubiquinol oxidase subunit 2 [compost metagenome]